MKIFVIRHGITQLNIKKKVNGEIDEPLAQAGIDQVNEAVSLIPQSITRIYSSSLLRARQSADIIGTKLNIFVSYHDELSEIRMGTLAGRAWEEMENGPDLKEKHRTVNFDYRTYGGESVDDVKNRLIPFFKKIIKINKDEEVLLVTHGGLIRLINFLENGDAVYKTQEHVSPLTIDLSKILQKQQI